MTAPVIGEPHSLQRYLTFGIAAGIIAGYLSVVVGIDLGIAGPALTAVAAWFAGVTSSSGRIA